MSGQGSVHYQGMVITVRYRKATECIGISQVAYSCNNVPTMFVVHIVALQATCSTHLVATSLLSCTSVLKTSVMPILMPFPTALSMLHNLPMVNHICSIQHIICCPCSHHYCPLQISAFWLRAFVIFSFSPDFQHAD